MLSGMAGFGALLIMVPSMLFMMHVDIVVPVGVLCGIATQLLNAFVFRRYLRKDSLGRLLLGCLPGLWLGDILLADTPGYMLRGVLGVLLMGYVLWNVFVELPVPNRPPAAIWGYTAGFVSGVIGGAFGINGPPAVVYATRTNWSLQEVRAFLGMFCGALYVITAIIMLARGMVKPEVGPLALLAVPSCLIGNYCGQRLTSRMRPEHFRRLILSVLFVMGCSLCWPALRILRTKIF